MSKTRPLNDLQRILLSTAAAREDGHIHPVADSIAGRTSDLEKAQAFLICTGLVTRDASEQPVITDAGKALIDGEEQESAPSPARSAATVVRISKTDAVRALLRREDGATLADLIEATGWLPHTTRAALTGLRKKGHDIARSVRVGVSVYHIAAVA